MKREKIKYLINEQCGNWTILDYDTDRHKRLCRCKCGRIETILLLTFRRGLGCEDCRIYPTRPSKGICKGFIYGSILRAAKIREIPVTISKDYIFELLEKQNYQCALTRLPLIVGTRVKDIATGKQTASLDRIDSSKGYEEGNVQWVHKKLNTMKWNHSMEEFLTLCRLVVENFK
jgi:hypothetical protein